MTSLICSPVMISRHNSGTLPAACLTPSWHRAAETIHLGAEMCCCSLTLALSQSRGRGAGWKGRDILDHFLNSASACPKNYCIWAGIVTGRQVERRLTGLQRCVGWVPAPWYCSTWSVSAQLCPFSAEPAPSLVGWSPLLCTTAQEAIKPVINTR